MTTNTKLLALADRCKRIADNSGKRPFTTGTYVGLICQCEAALRKQAASADEEIEPGNEAFDKGVFHALDVLAGRLGVTKYAGADGSGDYDTDLGDTIMNVMKAKGLYDDETGCFATIKASAVDREAIARELWQRFAPTHHIGWRDETHKAEYFAAADAIAALYAASSQQDNLVTLIRQYAHDLRRNSSGGDDYPFNLMRPIADYLERLIERAAPAASATNSAPAAPDVGEIYANACGARSAAQAQRGSALRLSDKHLWDNNCITRAQLKEWTDADIAKHSAGMRHTVEFLLAYLDANGATAGASDLVKRLRKAAMDFEGLGDWHANAEDSDCEPHQSIQGEMQEASKAAIEAADFIDALRTTAPPAATQLLDAAYEKINALGGTGATPEELAFVEAIGKSLEVIEELGGMDPKFRALAKPAAAPEPQGANVGRLAHAIVRELGCEQTVKNRISVIQVLERYTPPQQAGLRPKNFLAWARDIFGPVAHVRGERMMRFIEEATELAHADEMPRTTLNAIADRVYSRPRGDIKKEIGQALACLETYAESIGECADQLAELEWQRVQSIPQSEWGVRHAAKQAVGIALAAPASHDPQLAHVIELYHQVKDGVGK